MTHPEPTAEDFAAATERAQSFLSDSQFIGADRNIAQCFLEQSKCIATLEAALDHARTGWNEYMRSLADKTAEAQLSTRLPDRDGLDEIIRAWVKTLPFNVTEVLKQRHVTKLIDALLSGAATPAPTAAHLRRFREQTEAEVFGYVTGVEDAAALYESVNPASDDERIKGSPGAGAMGAVIEYRDKIRELLHAKSPPQGAEE